MSGRAEKSIPSPEGTAVVLVVSPLPADRFRLREILSQKNWNVHEASDWSEALALLHDKSIPVVLCENDQTDGAWDDLLNAAARLPAPPNLIVFSRLGDASLWAKVLSLGGFDLLMTPFEPEEVLRVTFAAWSRWRRDFAASTAKKVEAADPATASAEAKLLAHTPCRRENAADADGFTILVADDEPGIRKLAGEVLRRHGYNVLQAADGVEALELAAQHPGPIHLLLTELSIPRLDGRELHRRISNIRPGTATLFMSGDLVVGLQPHAALLPKPFASSALVRKVDEVLKVTCSRTGPAVGSGQ